MKIVNKNIPESGLKFIGKEYTNEFGVINRTKQDSYYLSFNGWVSLNEKNSEYNIQLELDRFKRRFKVYCYSLFNNQLYDLIRPDWITDINYAIGKQYNNKLGTAQIYFNIEFTLFLKRKIEIRNIDMKETLSFVNEFIIKYLQSYNELSFLSNNINRL